MRHEKRRLEVVQNNRVVAEQLAGALRETLLQLVLVLHVEAFESRLVITTLLLLVTAETFEKWIAAFALAPKKNEFRFALGNADQANQVDLRIVIESALEKLVFPVGPAGDVKDAVRLLAPLNRDDAAVVGHGGLLFAGLAFGPFRLANLDSVKRNTKRLRFDFKLDLHRLVSCK